MNETGPVTAQIHNANRYMKNLISFMEDEGFTQDQIDAIKDKVMKESDQKMLKMIKRWQLPKENRVMIKCFDHWVLWLKMRKLMKYHLRATHNMLSPDKADLWIAFKRWYNSDKNLEKHLGKFMKKDLQGMVVKQAKQLDELADIEGENAGMINYLNL